MLTHTLVKFLQIPSHYFNNWGRGAAWNVCFHNKTTWRKLLKRFNKEKLKRMFWRNGGQLHAFQHIWRRFAWRCLRKHGYGRTMMKDDWVLLDDNSSDDRAKQSKSSLPVARTYSIQYSWVTLWLRPTCTQRLLHSHILVVLGSSSLSLRYRCVLVNFFRLKAQKASAVWLRLHANPLLGNRY